MKKIENIKQIFDDKGEWKQSFNPYNWEREHPYWEYFLMKMEILIQEFMKKQLIMHTR